MGFFDSLAEFYKSLEDKYFALCDSLQDKGIAIYDVFVDPLESHGIPSFPIFVILMLLIFGGLFYVVSGALGPGSADLIVVVKSNGSNVDNALVTLSQDSKTLFSNATRNGTVAFAGIPKAAYLVSVSKSGYTTETKTVDLGKENLAVFALTCASPDCGKGVRPTVPVAPLVPIATPTPSQLDFRQTGDSTGSLSIYVFNQQNGPVDAVVKVFNGRNNVELKTLLLEGGHGRVDNLEAGMRIYLTAQAEGYLSYSNRTNVWVIQGGLNIASITLFAISGNASNASTNPNYNTSWIFVKNAQGAALANAEVQVFQNDGSGSPMLFGRYTNQDGAVSVILPRSTTETYYASASKTGYFVNASSLFKEGENATIILFAIPVDDDGNEIQSSLVVTVLDEFNAPVSHAIVGAYRATGSQILPFGTQETDYDGKVFFTGLTPASTVVLNASKGTRFGTAFKTLAVGDNFVNVSLVLNTGFLNLTAFDAVSGEIIPASFNASLNELSFEPCSGASCIIEVRSGVDVNVTASAVGFDSRTFTMRVMADEVKTQFVWLAGTDVVKDSLVSFEGLFDAQGKRVVNAYPGQTYNAKFYLATKDADLSGMHFEVDPSIAWISSINPPGAIVKVSPQSGCSAIQDYSEGGKFAWVDVTYGGSRNLEIIFAVTINPQVPLDFSTRSTDLSLRYRSFIKRDNAWIRNPFDYALLADEGQPLSSGCNAMSFEEIILISSAQTTCNEFGCVTMEFSQATQVGPHQNFSALSMLNVNPNSVSFAPVVVDYQVELFKPLAESTSFRFLQEPSSFLRVSKVSLPFAEPVGGGWLCENGASSIPVDDFGFAFDVSQLASCFDYASDLISIYSPFKFSGEITLKPVASTNFTDLTLSLVSGENAVSHSAMVNVRDPNYAENEFANVSMFVSQSQSPSSNEDDPFDAFITLPPLNVSFGVGILKPAWSHNITIYSSDGSVLNITNATIFVKRGSQAAKPSDFKIVVDAFGRGVIAYSGLLEPGDFVFGIAGAIPQKQGFSALSVVDTANLAEGTQTTFLTRSINVIQAFAPTSGLAFERISQLQDGSLKELAYPASQSEVFPAFTLEACENCGYGNVMLDYALPVSVDVAKARFKLNVSDNFDFASATAKITHLDSTESEIAFGASGTQEFYAKAGDLIFGSIELVPSGVGDGQVTLSFEGGMIPSSAIANFLIDWRPAPFEDPEQRVRDWISAGDCQRSELNSDASQLSVNCGNITMRSSSVFPADGIQVVVSSSSQAALTVMPIVQKPDGISNCFESCDLKTLKCASGFGAFTLPGTSVLRFNPLENANCPFYPLVGNNVPAGSITLKVWRSGLGEVEANGQNLNIKIVGFRTHSSLYAAPVTPILDVNKQYIHNIELWVLVNNRQIGKRAITVNNKLFQFDGPGVQTFVLPKGVTPVFRENGETVVGIVENRRTIQSVYKELAEVTELASKTAYWRGSQNQTWWCDEQLGECRSSLEEWQNVSYYYETTQTNCKFCNNSQGTPCSNNSETIYPTCTALALGQLGQFLNCDDRCKPIDPSALSEEDPAEKYVLDNYNGNGWTGFAAIDYGDSFNGKPCTTTMKGKSNASVFEFEACKQVGLCVENSTFVTVNGVDYLFCFGDSNGNGFMDESEAGSINVSKTRVVNGVTEYYCWNASTRFIIENKSCAFQCNAASLSNPSGWCGPDNETATALGVVKSCDIQCPAKGYYEEQGELITEFRGWYNVSQLITRESKLTPVAFAPFYYFRDYRAMQDVPVFEFHAPSDAQSYADAMFSLQDAVGALVPVNTVSGCLGNDGFYDFKEYNPGTLWTVDASVLELKKSYYLDTTAQCKKEIASWNQLKLCHPVYTDSSTEYGKCFNSLPINFGLNDVAFLRAPQAKSRETNVFQVSNDGNVAQATSLVGPKSCTADFQWYSPIAEPHTLQFKWSGKSGTSITIPAGALLLLAFPGAFAAFPILENFLSVLFMPFSFGKKSCARGKPTCKTVPDAGDNFATGLEKIYACNGFHPPDWGISSQPPSS